MKENNSESEQPRVEFDYEQQRYVFEASTLKDHILQKMLKTSNFYEIDVLERIRHQLRGRTGAALDVGAYMGTHSVYFSRVCRLHPIFAFEPNPDSHYLLLRNLQNNQANNLVAPIELGLGASAGYGKLLAGTAHNAGMTSLILDETKGITISTVDEQVSSLLPDSDIALIKIDVEGRELDVLEGARDTVSRHRPILCVEVHGDAQYKLFNAFLLLNHYGIVDCLGGSPTYIAQPFNGPAWRWHIIGQLWRLRAALRQPKLRGAIRHFCLRFGAGLWQPTSRG